MTTYSLKSTRFLRTLLMLSVLSLTSATFAATSVTRFEITWTFNTDYTVGQYANGDYYVVDPGSGVTIIDIDPSSTLSGGRTQHGSMVNPTAGPFAQNGFDSTLGGGGYQASLNAGRPNGNDISSSNPLVLSAGSSLISSITYAEADARPQLSDASVLTVVASSPPAGSFRPPYCGTDKTHYWNKSQLNYSILKTLTPVASTPTLSGVAANFERTWIEIDTQYTGREFHPDNNQPIYGRDMARRIENALLMLHLNFTQAEKETLYINLVQYGIDIYGAAVNGGNWRPNGGHNHGRKMPMIMAGLALGDSNILTYGDKEQHFIFQEDLQTWYVTSADVGRPVHDQSDIGRPREEYTSAHVGLPEWGITHWTNSYDDGSNWGVIYRDVVYSSSMGLALAAHLTPGAVETWNWPVYFDYMDRVDDIQNGDFGSNFVEEMWAAYRNTGGNQVATPIFSPGAGTYSGSQAVSMSTTTSGATIRYTTDGSTPTSTSGTVYSSPISITSTTVLKAIAYKSGSSDSAINTANYVISGTDTQAPTTPTGLAASNITATTANLDWNASADNVAVAGYNIYTGGSLSGSLTETSAVVTGLTPETSYTFTVSAYDTAQNESSQSSGVNLTTASAGGALISEDFASSAANFTEVSGGTWSVSSGRYVLSSPASSGTAGLMGNISVNNTSITGDYVLNAVMRITGTGSAWNDAAIVFGYQDANNYYYLSLNESNDGNTKGILKVVGGIPTELADISQSIASDTDYSIEIDRTGSTITVKVNGSQVASVTDSTFSSGLVGFGSYNDGAQFDDLLVTGASVGGDTEDPSTPTGLASSNVTATTVDLSWNASTDNVGVTGYKVYTDGANPVTIAGTSATVSGLSQNTSYTFTVSAIDAAGNESSVSSGASVTTADGQAPSVPTGLVSSNVTASTVDLDWNASTDNVGVTGYNIYVDGVYTDSLTGTSATMTGLDPDTSYTFTVRAYDAAGNESNASSGETVTTAAASSSEPIEIEITDLNAVGGVTSVTYDASDVTSSTTITPSTTAAGSTNVSSQTIEIEIDGLSIDGTGSGDDSVTFSIIAEAWGVSVNSSTPSMTYDTAYAFSTDNTSRWGNTGSLPGGGSYSSSTQFSSGEGITFSYVSGSVSLGSGMSGNNGDYTVDLEGFDEIYYDNRSSPATSLLNLDGTVSALSNASNDQTIDLSGVDEFGIGSESGAFRLSSLDFTVNLYPPSGDTTAPSTPSNLAASNVSTTSVDLGWSASTDNVAVTGYKIYTNGSSPVSVMGTSTTISGLTQNTSYTFTVTAVDAAMNESSASSGVNVTTLDGQAPTTPTSLAAGTITATSIDLSWSASSDNVAVTGYKVFTGGSNPVTVTGTSTTISGLTQYTSYTFTVSAIDAAGNESTASSGVNVTTLDGEAPGVPSGLAASNITTSGVDLSWNASSDNVAVTGYKLYTNGSSPVSITGTSTSLSSLSQGTTYLFSVSAVDAQGNESAQSGALSVTTVSTITSQTIEISNLNANGSIGQVIVNGTDMTSSATVTPDTTACGSTGVNSQTIEIEITGLTIDGSGTGDDSVTFSIIVEAWGATVNAGTPSMTLGSAYIFSVDNSSRWGNTGASGGGCFSSSTQVGASEALSFSFVSGTVELDGEPSEDAMVVLSGLDAISYDNRATPASVVVLKDGQASALSNPDNSQTIDLEGILDFAIGTASGGFRLDNLDFTIEIVTP